MRLFRSHLLLVALLAGFAGPVLASASTSRPRQQQNCNGSPDLCSRRYSDVTFVGSHDSAFVGVLPTDNQFVSVARQLGLGVRFLQAQTHDEGGTIELCHTSCLEKDAGTLADYLAPVKTFLDANPDEVVSLLLTNEDTIPVAQFGSVFQAAGLDTYAYTPANTLALADWPTLGDLIASGKRLIVFMDYHANTVSVPYILDEFAYYYETPYDTTDPDFPQCTVDRPPGASADGRMGIVNHFLDYEIDLFGQKILVPDVLRANETNAASSITAQTNLCLAAYNRQPNVVLLDFISVGEGITAQSQLNNLS
ncbi:PLC-like phosphodiesterase, TIM beta/alpha-barrel domain protein [Niveomyces insectorum RCEF 264]|uniref:PLC-like phosphodiesterase, TIM beta/alpha-barrel domain protein n=1 Tax=Niveomyces insectorum RCEF 264 TaxID=1081102 RepID=A0A167UVH8_9HYPO|nr:PLC-like phosphodiesterase, TIM beta/alpha-barrel domain protein [Niveomyces insectorum RCEF 264]